MAISVRVEPARLAAPAGSDVDAVVVVTNPLDEQVHVRVVVQGDVAGWATVEPADLWIAPTATARCALRFRLPRGAPGGVGEVPFVVRVLSDHEGAGGASADAVLAVEGQAELAVRLVPGSIKGTVSAHGRIAVDNLGTVPGRAQLVAADDGDGSAEVEIEPDSLLLEPGETTWARVTVRPRRRHLAGAARTHRYRVRLEPLGGARVSVEGEMVQRSLAAGFLPRILLAAMAFVAVALGLGVLLGGDDGDTTVGVGAPLTTIATTTTTAPPETTAPQPVAGAPTTTVPLAAKRIAFQTERDGNSEIYTTKPDGTEPINVTLNLAHDSEPAWSPDGTRLAFDSDRSGNFDVWVMNADGTNPVQLTTEPTPDGYPTWSPDGTRLAFISFRDGNSEIYVMNADGTGQTRLTKNLSDDARPAWSPDGAHIAFHTDRDGNYEIYVMAPDGTSPQNLSANPATDQNPAWSPNSTRLAFDSTRDGGKAELYLMGADGSLPVRLTKNDTLDKWPEWSPDGRRVVFQADPTDDLELYVIDAGGGIAKRITDFPGDDAEPSW